METTIQYLRELLAREMANKYDKEQHTKLKIELDASQYANSLIRKDFEEEIKKLRLDLNYINISKQALIKELAEAIEEKESFQDKLKVSLDKCNNAEEQLVAVENNLKETSKKLTKAKDEIKNLESANKMVEEEVF